jgi:hypothetical protein
MLYFERLPLDNVDWKALDALPDRTLFQTLPWLRFVARTQGAEPVVATLRQGTSSVGYFTGLVVTRCGCRILGSPFKGWTSYYMGFSGISAALRRPALAALVDFAFNDLHCVHLELMDRSLTAEDGSGLSFEYRECTTFEIDLGRSEAEILASMKNDPRRCIRKSKEDGVTIEEAHDVGFADDYYPQLQDVFAKQGLVPTYSLERVRALIECILPTGNLLLVRARDRSGRCIGTGIFPAMKDTMYFWGGASWRQFQILHPNDPIQWYAMRYWKARGVRRYDMGGGGEYKRKYGGLPVTIPWFRKSKYPVIACLRRAAQQMYRTSQKMSGLGLARGKPALPSRRSNGVPPSRAMD